jgi:hypothetical protein
MDWKSIGGQLAKIGLPLLGGALGGPGGALIGKSISAALGLGQDATPEQTATALGNMTGEQLVAIRALEVDLAKAQLQADTSLALGQIETNKIEAAQPGIYKGGWRPAAGWSSVFLALIYPAIRLLLPWSLKVAGVEGVPDLPPLDTSEAIVVLGSLLGVGAMRHRERVVGKA